MEAGQEFHGTQLYDVEATVAGGQQLTLAQMRPLLQDLLRRRFGLMAHTEDKLVSGYAMVVAKNGPKLQASTAGPAESRFYIMNGRIFGPKLETATLAGMLGRSAGAPVMDKTGLTGTYAVDLRFRPDSDTNSNLPDLFTAVQEQLGLKLVPVKVPVQYLVVDHVDREPTEN